MTQKPDSAIQPGSQLSLHLGSSRLRLPACWVGYGLESVVEVFMSLFLLKFFLFNLTTSPENSIGLGSGVAADKSEITCSVRSSLKLTWNLNQKCNRFIGGIELMKGKRGLKQDCAGKTCFGAKCHQKSPTMNLLYSTGISAQCSVMTQRGAVRGREAPEGGDMCILIANSPCCTAETNNIVKQLSSN